MVTFLHVVYSAPENVDEVERRFRSLNQEFPSRPGLINQKILKSPPPASRGGGHFEAPGVQFTNVEVWENAEARATERKNEAYLAWMQDLETLLLPLHYHAYQEVIVDHNAN
jgi:quinol monooxygenase YgiN